MSVILNYYPISRCQFYDLFNSENRE